jgi:hypothetical protein
VKSVPAASLEVDGQKGNDTPTRIDLEAGKKHVIVLRAECFKDEKLEVDAKDGMPAIDAKLKPLDRVLHVESTPKGAKVMVDGKDAGVTPTDVKVAAKAAEHKVTLKLKGHEDSEALVSADAECKTDGQVGRLRLAVTLKEKAEPVVVKKPDPPRPDPVVKKPDPVVVKKPEPPKPPDPPKPEPPKPDPDKQEPPKGDPVKSEPKPDPPKPDPPKADPPKPDPPKPDAPKQDCDPSPDAPDWARCK